MKRLLMIIVLVAACAHAAEDTKVLVVGFDGMDPLLLQKFRDEGVMPNFDKFVADGGEMKPLGTSTPPQSPVAWSNFITGRDSGGHGIFDFIHRDPQTLLPYFSASEAKGPTRFWRIGDWKIPRGGSDVINLRQGTAFWELLSDAGIDATIFKVPINFPPVECEARSLSGMGTPDLTGNYGISTLITDDPPLNRDLGGGRIVPVYLDRGRFVADLEGPANSWREGDPVAKVEILGRVDEESGAVWLTVGDEEVVIAAGEWSGWVPVNFEMIPMMKTVQGICRFYAIETSPTLRLYVTPVQIDPANPEMPISTPSDYSQEIVQQTGAFYTQGLPDDTSALENGFFTDDDFVQQSTLVLEERLAQFSSELDRFAELDEGFLFFYFNSPDQTCHMTWRNMDPGSPTHDESDLNHANRIRDVYQQLDDALALAIEKAGPETTVMVMSDHGFAPWNRAFHLNTWLYENGYLVLQDGYTPGDIEMHMGIDWWRTRAYAVGINGLYLNLAGREQQGSVEPGEAQEALLVELKEKLEAAVDPIDGRRAIKTADRGDVVYHGEMRDKGPDIVVGYYRGWRGSNESALGRIMPTVFSDNMLKWSGDHCIAADEVPGVLLANRAIVRAEPALVDLAPTILRLFGLEPPADMVGADLFTK
ncbi:MAG: putative AlkP superfamily phosphohydrolase/phosphomutase [Candidatus Krumholzibacteriia bacterium]|jgi:predicted AlkP superfamily phosphohydrolase/phosphomutase